MRELVGRDHERKLLQKALRSNKPELIAIYGRRRVGKTFLIRESLGEQIAFELVGLHHGRMRDQLTNFKQRLAVHGMEAERPANWLEAFGLLEQFIRGHNSRKKKVIFIDEFPWLATRRSRFLMAFENFWNSFASKRSDLVIIICGSAAAYMVGKIVRNRGGLHNRITQTIRLLPFSLYETRQFLKSRNIKLTDYDILQLYMSIGGIPQYLEHIQAGQSVAQMIDSLCFEKDAPLATEFLDVFASLYEYPERHEAIVRALARTRKGLTRNQISEKSKLPSGGRLTQTLRELEESGFIQNYPAFGQSQKDSLYRLSDEYSLFYLNFIENARTGGKGTWLKRFASQTYRSWSGFSFESVCLKHIEAIKKSLGISGVYSENYSWLEKNDEKGQQIDLLIDRADNVVCLCEMKFHNAPFAISKGYAEELRQKAQLFKEKTKTRKNIFIVMISSYGLSQNAYSLELVQNDLKLDVFFKASAL